MGPDNKNKIMYNSNFKESNPKEKANRKNRTILHCDADSFFASCEMAIHPEYASVPMAVCGSVEDRHGIVLAKNAIAKKYNIKTGETLWQAKQKCPSLVMVRPTYGIYSEISQKLNRIFYDYTDLVEPFGIDESWLDVTGSLKLFGSGLDIAEAIRKRVKTELGITVSVGIAFNKVFAKLGSDLNKPDGVTVITAENYMSKVWGLPVSSLLFVGPACAKSLARVGIYTIGELAMCDREFISEYMGKNGLLIRDFALGRDFSTVSPMGFEPQPKSISNGMTFRANLVCENDISFALTYLSMSVAERLRKHGLNCKNVSVTMRFPDQSTINRSLDLLTPTCLYNEIAPAAMALVKNNCPQNTEIYAISVSCTKLSSESENALQQQMFISPCEEKSKKFRALESAVDSIKGRFGNKSIGIASAINNPLL